VQVITLSPRMLESQSHQLAERIFKEHPDIDIIAGIATGGAYVSRHMRSYAAEHGWEGTYTEISLSRQSTHTKQKLGVQRMLKKLPYPVLDMLRNVEAWYLARRDTPPSEPPDTDFALPLALEEALPGATRLLLVDDAVDSGLTMLRVVHKLNERAPHLSIVTAALTLTRPQPLIVPDYTLYINTLLRCPWAMDYKGSHA